jgi:hypothetical protein
MKKLIAFLLIAASIGVFGFKAVEKAHLTQNVTGYLKHAADANTVPLALQELTKVIDYLEANNLTEGYTSIFYRTPSDDIGFWYQNLKASQIELQNLKPTSALERTNVLMKLRETLTDSGRKSQVTYPKGIDVFPNNKLWAILLTGAIVAFFTGCILLIPTENKGSETQLTVEKS